MVERDPDDPARPDPQPPDPGHPDPVPGPPPHPLDRVWAHPSELGAVAAAPAPAAAQARPPLLGMATGALLGALVTLAIVLALGGVGDDPGGSGSAFVPTFPELRADPAARLVATVSASVVVVRTGAADAVRTGTGVVLGDDRILTNAGVVTGDDPVSVTTADGSVVPAVVLGRDPETDLAVLRAEGTDVPGARMGSADDLAVGTWVLAVGASGSQRRWANEGIISGMDVVVADPSGYRLAGLLGTDIDASDTVAGGPLLDASGAVVAFLSRSVPGYAVPIDAARAVAEQLVAGGSAAHGWLGAVAVDETDRPRGGARVESVVPGGPAEAAGLVAGDVVTAIGERRITDGAELMSVIARLRPGDPVEVTYWRDDRRHRADASLGARAADAVGLAAVAT